MGRGSRVVGRGARGLRGSRGFSRYPDIWGGGSGVFGCGMGPAVGALDDNGSSITCSYEQNQQIITEKLEKVTDQESWTSRMAMCVKLTSCTSCV